MNELWKRRRAAAVVSGDLLAERGGNRVHGNRRDGRRITLITDRGSRHFDVDEYVQLQ